MSVQTRYSVVDDETMQGLKEAIVKLMKEELGKLRNQMRTMVMTDNNEAVVQKGVQNIPKFGGEDVKGWLVQIEQFFEDNNVPDESKVSFISTHLYEIAWEWHKQFLRIIRGEVAWVIYKEALLLRFGNNKQFLSNDVKDSSCGLHVIDKVGDLLVNNNHCEVNLERSECAHKLFDEMPIKEIHKQDTLAEYCDASVKESIEVEQGLGDDVVVESVKELVDGDNGLIDDRLLASNCDQEGFGEDVNLGEKVTDIKTNDVSRLKSFESTKGGLEMLTRNGVNYMEGLVGVDISAFGQKYVHTAKAKGPDIGCLVTTPFVQTLSKKEYQWLCDMNKFSKDSISWFCKFRVECVGVQSDLNHDDGLVVCNQLSEFNHSVVSQRTVEEEVYDAPELVPIPVGTKEGTELVMNILDSFESSYDESGKQGTGGNRIGLKGTFLDYVTVMEIQVGNLNDRVIDSSVGTGANNDLAIPNYSPLSDNLLNDIAHVAPFEANEVGFENGYYLADGIYLQWATFVKSFTVA
ncbi:floral homeotic protein [Tanacetum coccineum]